MDIGEPLPSSTGGRAAGEGASSATDGASGRKRRLAFFVGIFVVTLASRVPFLDAGYGRINDAWRVATAAREIGITGRYTASRFPPHPVQEIVCSLLWRWGPAASNAATAVASSFAVLFFALSFARLGIDGILEGSAALAFAPIIFVNSTSSTDYLWALAFILGSLYFVLDRQPIAAGVLLGLAIGSRITSGAMLLPLSILAWRILGPRKRALGVIQFAGAAGLAGAVTFIPVFERYGWSFLTFTEHSTSPSTILERASLALWGHLGTAAIVVSLGWWIVRTLAKRAPPPSFGPKRRAQAWLWILPIALYVIAFVRLPHLPAYLIPAVPFVLLLLATLLPPPVFRIVCFAVVVSSFVTVGRGGLSAGPIVEDHWHRIEGVTYTKRIVELGRTLNRETVVVAGHWEPKIEFYLPGGTSGPVQYVYLLDAKSLRSYQARGFDIRFLPGQSEFNLAESGVDLLAEGARPLIPASAGWHW